MVLKLKFYLPDGKYKAVSNGIRSYCESHSNDGCVLEIIQNSPFYWAAYHLHGITIMVKSFETIRGIRHLNEPPSTELIFCGDEKLVRDFISTKLRKINGHKLICLEGKIEEPKVIKK